MIAQLLRGFDVHPLNISFQKQQTLPISSKPP